MRILPGTEDVEVAEANGLQPVKAEKNLTVLLSGQLGDGIGGNGIGLHQLPLG
jgi:hypothetical protein